MFPPAVELRPQISACEHENWTGLIRQRCGLYFDEQRTRYLCQCLWERMRARGCSSYAAYHHVVARSTGDAEWQALLDLLLNNETSFFRHAPAFEALPRLLQARLESGQRHLRLWSAGCSTGEEPYSMAMVALDALPLDGGASVEILGSDLSERSLAAARQGHYKLRRIRSIPERHLRRHLTLPADGREGFARIGQELRGLVRFESVNLAGPLPSAMDLQDVVLCQNVLIYFQAQDRVGVVHRLCEQLAPGGFLLLGPADGLGLKLPGIRSLSLEGSVVYQRLAPG